MNGTPLLSVVVDVVQVRRPDLLPRGNHRPFTTRVSRLGGGAGEPPARWRDRTAWMDDSARALTGCPPPVPRRSARTGRLDRAGTTQGRMMTFVKRVRSAAVVVLLAGSPLGP